MTTTTRDPWTTYGTPEHEEWLLECEAREEGAPYWPDHPYTPCGCVSRAYGGDCAHTLEAELEAELEHDPSGRECALAGRGDPSGCPLCLADIAAGR
jgi:hypothetical protein